MLYICAVFPKGNDRHIEKAFTRLYLINRNVGNFRLVIQRQVNVDAHECIDSRVPNVF